MDRRYIRSVYLERDQLKRGVDGVHPKLLAFEKSVLSKGRRAGIPLVVTFFEDPWLFPEIELEFGANRFGLGCEIRHGVLGENLSRKAWAILAHLGREASRQGGLSIVWGGPDRPSHWEHAEWRGLKGEFPFPPPTDDRGRRVRR